MCFFGKGAPRSGPELLGKPGTGFANPYKPVGIRPTALVPAYVAPKREVVADPAAATDGFGFSVVPADAPAASAAAGAAGAHQNPPSQLLSSFHVGGRVAEEEDGESEEPQSAQVTWTDEEEESVAESI